MDDASCSASDAYTDLSSSTSSDEELSQVHGKFDHNNREKRRRQDQNACYDALRSLFPGGHALSKRELLNVASRRIIEVTARTKEIDAQLKKMDKEHGHVLAKYNGTSMSTRGLVPGTTRGARMAGKAKKNTKIEKPKIEIDEEWETEESDSEDSEIDVGGPDDNNFQYIQKPLFKP